MLIIRNLVARNAGAVALDTVSLTVDDQSITAVYGPGCCGKTSLAEAISGILPVTAGRVEFDGADITRIPPRQRLERGMFYVPAGRTLFARLTLLANLEMAARAESGGALGDLNRVLPLFPELRLWLRRRAGDLPFGVQRIAIFARALMRNPRLLILDEAWAGLTGEEIERVSRAIQRIRKDIKSSVLLIGQNLFPALKLADTAYAMDRGRIIGERTGLELLADRSAQAEFLRCAWQPAAGAP